MSEVEYFHKDRHPRCCCVQCVSDEAEHEISGLRRFVLDSTSFLQAELNEQKNERVHWQQRAWIAEDKVERLKDLIAAENELRPRWAQGYSSDSVAAQCSQAALSEIFKKLGVTNQTEAMQALEEKW